MEYNIKGKRIVVTGGADGIGYAIADKYLQAGAELVILIDINEINGVRAANAMNETYGTDKAVYIKCDVTIDLKCVFETIINLYKRIDVLVNSAGTSDDTVPRRMIDINATAVAEWSLQFYEHMRTDRNGSGGTILNISSILGYRVLPIVVIYQMAKSAVQALTRSLGHEDNFKKTSVRVISLCPGFTCTNLTADLKKAIDEDNDKSELISEDLISYVRGYPWQDVEVVGEAALQIFQRAKTSTSWLIEGGKPIEEILYPE